MEKISGKIIKNFFTGFICLFAALLMLTANGCGSGGGGGGDDVDDDQFSGGNGTGADNVVTFWQYYGTLNAGEVGRNEAVDIAADGGYVAAGNKSSDFNPENNDYFVVKTSADGREAWRFTSAEPGDQTLMDVASTPDGGVIAVGYTGSGSTRDALVVKLDANGTLQWSKTYDAGTSESDEAHAVCVLSNGYAVGGGGFHEIITGGGNPFNVDDLRFFKIDVNGNKIEGSDRFYSMPGWSRAYAMARARDNGFILAGMAPQNSVFIVRLDENGDDVWNGIYGIGMAHSVCQLPPPDNGFVVAGVTPPFADKESDVFVLKVDESGNERWHKVLGGGERDMGYGVTATPQGDILVVGETRSFNSVDSTCDFYLIKLDKEGTVIWQKVKGMSPQNYETAYDVRVTSDGGFVVAGSAQAMNMLAKFDKNGDTITLGDMDFTYTVSETSGLINMANARVIASVAAEMIMLPFELGAFSLDLFIDTLNNIPAGDLCDSGGTYTWNRPPALPVGAGDGYVVSFSGCKSDPSGDDPSTYNGTIALRVEAVSGDITGDDYDIRVTIDPVDLVFTDDVGDGSIDGGMVYSRISTGGNFAERVDTDGKNLRFEEDSGSETLTQMDVNATRSRNGNFTVGNSGQYAIVDTDLIIGPLTVTFQTAISGTDGDEPEQGKLKVAAQDGSHLTMSLSDGDLTVDVDTDNDGAVDGTFSAEWMDLD